MNSRIPREYTPEDMRTKADSLRFIFSRIVKEYEGLDADELTEQAKHDYENLVSSLLRDASDGSNEAKIILGEIVTDTDDALYEHTMDLLVFMRGVVSEDTVDELLALAYQTRERREQQ